MGRTGGPPGSPSDGIRVLHVDDDPSVTEVVAAYLEREREALTVDSENDAEAALERMETEWYDCVVSDYQMPGMDGMEFLLAVRGKYPDLPFVLFTGEGSETLAGEAISAGVTDYIQKGDPDQYTLLTARVVNAAEGYRATRELRRQTDLFEKTQRLADVGGWEYDIRNDHVKWSDGVYRVLDADRDYQPTLEDLSGFFHPDDREEIRAAVDAALEDGESYDIEVRIGTDDDEVRWARVQGELQYEDDEKARLRGTIRDITDRKRRERRLRDHSETIEALHRAATDIAAAETVEDVADRTITAARDLLDFRLCSVLYYRDGWLEPIAISEESPEDGARTVRADEEGEGGLAGKTYRTGESYVIDRVTPEDVSEPAKDTYESGISVPIGDVAVFQAVAFEPEHFDEDDVERAELLAAHAASAFDRLHRERELRERNERLDQFARVVSHDLRNPIQVLRGSVELARETGDTDHLDTAEETLDRMERIVTDLLTIAREGDDVDEVQPLELSSVARAAWDTADTGEAEFDATGVEDRVVVADRSRLRQLFENLFRNSAEHASTAEASGVSGDGGRGEAGTVSVRVGWLTEASGFYVEDDGPGIPAEEREAVFETGYSTTDDGTGFGLAIAKRVAEAHGWRIRATEGDTGGARFEISGVETR